MPDSIPVNALEKYATFGELLLFLRRWAGITQQELALAVGYSDAQISRLEQNRRSPDLPMLQARFVPALGLEDEPRAVARLVSLAAASQSRNAPGSGRCPYQGLDFYDEADADKFFGREALTEELAKRIIATTVNEQANATRLLAILGDSGCGKSSLLRAGLVPALRRQKVSASWSVYICTPTAHPLESLAASLTLDQSSLLSTATLMDEMAREPRSLSLFIHRICRQQRISHSLLLIDQFEEVFRLCRSEEERSQFIDNLLIAAGETDGPTSVIIVMRTDSYLYCNQYPRFFEALTRQAVTINPMNAEEMRDAIEEPACRGGWDFEPGLVDFLLQEAGYEAGALPFISRALLATWQRRRGRTLTLSSTIATGGIRGAVIEQAEAVFTGQLSPAEQPIARSIFLRLAAMSDPGATCTICYAVHTDELILNPDEALIVFKVLKTLADARLVITSQDAVQIAHEALVRGWPRLLDWLNESREDIRIHRRLAEATRGWLATGRDPEALHHGTLLAQTRAWAYEHEHEINAWEREFLEASATLVVK